MVHSGESLESNEQDALLARLMELAEAVFDDTEKAKRWMTTPSLMLGAAPLDLLGSAAGARAVEEELVRIEHGDFA